MNLALFDFDGTVTTNDTWTPFMKLVVGPTRLLAVRILMTPVVAAYRLGFATASQGPVIATRAAFLGVAAVAVRQAGELYARTAIPGTLRDAALERIAWHLSRGDDVVIVSASLDAYLGPWCQERGLAYICTTLEERDGTLTGRSVDGDCSGRQKARRILEPYNLAKYDLVYAYGDTAEDREMLALADKKYYRWKEISSCHEIVSHGRCGVLTPAVNARRRVVPGLKTVADPTVLRSLLRRLEAIRPERQRRWGTLTSHEMLCHLGDATAMVLRTRPREEPVAARHRPVLKRLALWSPLRWPHGRATNPAHNPRLDGTRPSEFASDLARAAAGTQGISSAAPGTLEPVHGLFGTMSNKDWQRWAYRHTDHHLRQFGL